MCWSVCIILRISAVRSRIIASCAAKKLDSFCYNIGRIYCVPVAVFVAACLDVPMYCDLSAFAEITVASFSLSAPYSDTYEIRSLIFAVAFGSVDRYGKTAYCRLCIWRIA